MTGSNEGDGRTYEHLILERLEGHVALITLNRPEKLNALNKGLQDDSRAVLAELADDDSVRAVVVTGAGRGFCSGADLTSGERLEPGAAPPRAPHAQRLDEYGWVGRQALAFHGFPKPIVAAVNGVATGAGMSMALACDLRVGSELTRMKTTFIERSLSPDSGMSFFLPRIVGYARAADLIFTSRMVEGEEAFALGLVNRYVSSTELLPTALGIARQIAGWPPVAMRSAKRVLQHNSEAALDEAVRYEGSGLKFSRLAPHDVEESRRSFLERRAPIYTGD
ncbi:MAG: enoyl-CoA hydratase/isomerase family protein [Dehalococcoidia bacterium]|nr:enoyl-CoA hydratase/isomerase family protein [Dehalococcoidia bacterium]